MMHKGRTCFSDSVIAWEHWHRIGFEQRKEVLAAVKERLTLTSESIDVASVVNYHIHQVSESLSEIQWMKGATGETNEFYAEGRGVTLIAQQSQCKRAISSVFSMLTAALITGNSVVLCSDNNIVNILIDDLIEQDYFPENVIIMDAFNSLNSWINNDIQCVGLVGDTELEIQINRHLAMRDGAIVSFVSEMDLAALNVALDPFLYLRFITERTRTINITAIGGNASLLELGNDVH